MTAPSHDRYLIVSTDGHAGLLPEKYRDYLDPQFRETFDAQIEAEIAERAAREKDFLIKDYNEKWREGNVGMLAAAWDSDLRNQVIDDDGVAAEVLFPDGITERNAPPFGAGLSLKPWGVKPELQWAGARAHNRWMAEFCQQEPTRRIGLAIVPMLYDVDDAVAEVIWAHEHGLKGILIPALMGDRPAYNHPRYHPVWRACAERGMVVHTHSGPAPDYDFSLPGAMGVFLCEFAWWAARPLWHLIFGGAFELFPELKFCLTEVSEFWVPSMLEMMDVRASVKHTSGKLGDFRSNLTLKPSEYWRRNCWLSASALFDEGSTAVRHQIGMESVMWGTDFPHPEGSWPHTKEKMKQYMTGIPEAELTMMLSTNALTCYGLDAAPLHAIAARIGPPKALFVGDPQ
ncbi:MAG: amidohydrolase [Myxococcales bacterium]|nr:amidohydrolase [Myxococcales bacterium]MCB9630226.1 amidohydrolase [Sandaracinaceae bacterium]